MLVRILSVDRQFDTDVGPDPIGLYLGDVDKHSRFIVAEHRQFDTDVGPDPIGLYLGDVDKHSRFNTTGVADDDPEGPQ